MNIAMGAILHGGQNLRQECLATFIFNKNIHIEGLCKNLNLVHHGHSHGIGGHGHSHENGRHGHSHDNHGHGHGHASNASRNMNVID